VSELGLGLIVLEHLSWYLAQTGLFLNIT